MTNTLTEQLWQTVETAFEDSNIDHTITIYRGGDPYHPLYPNTPMAHIVLDNIPEDEMPPPGEYSNFDIGYNIGERHFYIAHIHLLHQHRGGTTSRRLIGIAEIVAKELGFNTVKVDSIHNPIFLIRLLDLGYTARIKNSGLYQCEKPI